VTAAPAPAAESMILATDLSKSFDTKSGDTVHAVRGIDLDIPRGEAFGFLGPNGAGKSSTMRMVACVSPRTSGSLSILGMDPSTQGIAIRDRLGVIPQQDNLDEELTVRENLFVYARYFGFSKSYCWAKADELLEFAQLTEKATAKVTALSGGMKRRLTIARSLVNDPEMLLLDEPTTGLDPQARHVLWDRLFRLKQAGVTLVLTTHYMDEAEQLCDRLVVMDAGKIVAEGSPVGLIEQYSTREVVELRFVPGSQHAAEAVADSLAERMEVLPDRLLLYTPHGDETLEAAHAAGIEPLSSLVRRSTLEDVFLRLTGRSLVD
jgi:lipooligosaccharide transport system ATP-binding protein